MKQRRSNSNSRNVAGCFLLHRQDQVALKAPVIHTEELYTGQPVYESNVLTLARNRLSCHLINI